MVSVVKGRDGVQDLRVTHCGLEINYSEITHFYDAVFVLVLRKTKIKNKRLGCGRK